ncbi:MAG: signal peptidase I [Lachnospiraceae bacterium]|nr:signal peptidase I [Lachnospiraceae bacterium]
MKSHEEYDLEYIHVQEAEDNKTDKSDRKSDRKSDNKLDKKSQETSEVDPHTRKGAWAVRILELLFTVFMLMLCGITFMAGQGKVPYILGYRVLKVVSDSMRPTIEDRTCIFVKKVAESDIKVGDIITFISEAPDIRGFYNTHRVDEIIRDNASGAKLFITKGDNKEYQDAYPVSYDQVIGRYAGQVPFGNLIFRGTVFLMDRNNYFVIVILPLMLCCLSYMRQLFKALLGKEEQPQEETLEERLRREALESMEEMDDKSDISGAHSTESQNTVRKPTTESDQHNGAL